jgi:hypothetical protein
MNQNGKKPPLNNDQELGRIPPLSAECLKAPFRGFFTFKGSLRTKDGQPRSDQVKNLWSMSYIFSFGGLDFLLHAGRLLFFIKLTITRFYSRLFRT